MLDLKRQMAKEHDQIWEDLEAIKYENRKANTFMGMHKAQFNKLNTAIGVLHYNIDEIDAQIKDFGDLAETCAETEQYIGYVLPLKIEAAIYKNLVPIQKGKEQKLTLMENTQEAWNELQEKMKASVDSL